MMLSLAGTPLLESARRPVVAATAVMPRSSGISAATSEPSTNIRMMIVSGIEMSPAFASPPLISASMALSLETPSESIVKPGCRDSTWSTAATIVSM